MNLEKVVFGFFVLLAATLNFGFFIGDMRDPELHNPYELFAADAAAASSRARRIRRSSSSRTRRDQNASRGLPTTASVQPRWNDTVSTTRSTTETTWASSAPPDSETTLAVQESVSPAEET